LLLKVCLAAIVLLAVCVGRVLRNDKRGAISSGTANILNRLDIDKGQWLEMTSNFEDCFSSFVVVKVFCAWFVKTSIINGRLVWRLAN
jgi:hypothetical protein